MSKWDVYLEDEEQDRPVKKKEKPKKVKKMKKPKENGWD